ncbi:MAG: DUF721 domain-containing protein [Alphaproteobacteria bacterium]|nr:MAG: DUF721 domain-containing protein [Alphaproteobacteria bacterium]
MARRTDPSGAEEHALRRRRKGFEPAAGLIARPLRKASERRGFAVARLLTAWDEIVGPEIAAMARPVRVSYGREGIGATLTVLTSGAYAPLVQAQCAAIRERVNACYGYNAISRVRVTQTDPHALFAGPAAGQGAQPAWGLAEAQAPFAPAPTTEAPDPAIRERAAEAVKDVTDENLRRALEALAAKVLSRSEVGKGG